MLDIDTAIGDSAQLGHSSALHPGQTVPRGEALARMPGAAHRRRLPGRRPGPVRQRPTSGLRDRATGQRARCSPPPLTTAGLLRAQAPGQLTSVLELGPVAVRARRFYLQQLAVSSVLFFGGPAVGPVVLGTLPRLLAPRARARIGLPPLRHPLLDLPRRQQADQHTLLHQPVRRQLLHHRVPADDRLPDPPLRPDRLQLRRSATTRDTVPMLRRRRHHGLRRRCARQRRISPARPSAPPR